MYELNPWKHNYVLWTYNVLAKPMGTYNFLWTYNVRAKPVETYVLWTYNVLAKPMGT